MFIQTKGSNGKRLWIERDRVAMVSEDNAGTLWVGFEGSDEGGVAVHPDAVDTFLDQLQEDSSYERLADAQERTAEALEGIKRDSTELASCVKESRNEFNRGPYFRSGA